MRALARVLTIGSFAGLGAIAYTVFSPLPPTQPLQTVADTTTEEMPLEESQATSDLAPVVAVGIRITPEDIASNSQPTLNTQHLLDAVPEVPSPTPPRRQRLAEAIQPSSKNDKTAAVTQEKPGVSTADLIRLTEAISRSAVSPTRLDNQSGLNAFAFAPGVGLPMTGNSSQRPRASSYPAATNAPRSGSSGGGGGGSPAFGGASSNSPSLGEQGGVLEAITAPAFGASSTTSGSNLLAANLGTGADANKDYSKFGIQNAQFWAFDFTAGDNANGDVNGDNIVDVQDARFQFDAYLDYLQQELDSPEHLQVVRNSVDDLSRIFDEFNSEAAAKQDPDPSDAISENFVSYMIIEFDTKGFYLPNNQKFQNQTSNSNAWQFSANPNPGLNP